MAPTRLGRVTTGTEARAEVFREAITMVLYVSVVEIAELSALPEEHFTHGRVTGAVAGKLLAVLWGTAVGLAIAHWFAFQFAAPLFRGERPNLLAVAIGLGEVAGPLLGAAVSSLLSLLLSSVRTPQPT